MAAIPTKGSGNRTSPDRDLVASLAVGLADRDRAVARRTRGVVLASLGVMQDQKAGRKRVRAVALAAAIGVLLLVAPLVWWAADNLIGGEHMGDLPSEFSLWVCVLCPALLAAAVVAGWLRNRR
jgi:hypothetical protein